MCDNNRIYQRFQSDMKSTVGIQTYVIFVISKLDGIFEYIDLIMFVCEIVYTHFCSVYFRVGIFYNAYHYY